MKDAVIFDFDGTLADSMEAARRVFNQLALEYGMEQVGEGSLAGLRHLGPHALLKTLGIKHRHLPAMVKKGRLLLREQMHDLSPCEGVFEQFPELRKRTRRCGILTSNSVENVEIFLKTHGVRDHFDFISSCRRLMGKAKSLKAIARTYSLEPSRMLYIGDEVRDVKACCKAGVPVVAVSWGFNSREALEAAKPDVLLDDPLDLVTAVGSSPQGQCDTV